LELTSGEAIGFKPGMVVSQSKKERLSFLNRSQPQSRYETNQNKLYQDLTPATSQAQQGNP
jgi:hypothetical protein